MKQSTRFLIPVLAAVLVMAGLLAIVWWQISQSQNRLRAELNSPDRANPILNDFPGETDVVATGDRVLLHLRQGDVDAARGDWGSAEAEYRGAVESGGGVPALRKLAQAQLQRRNVDGAKETIERLRAEGARGEDLLLLEVIVNIRGGELQKAQELLAGAADSPQKHYGLALIAIINNSHDAAKQELALVVAGWEPTLRAYARILQEAYEEFANFPDSTDVHLNTLLARALAQTQECELALPILAHVLTQQPDYRDGWVVRGYCELVTERAAEATTSLKQAYELDPEKPEIQYFLGRAAMAQENWEEAVTYFSYALQNGFTPEREARRYLADAAQKLGNTALALEQLRALMALPDSDIDVATRLVTLLLKEDQADAAFDVARQAVSRWSQNARSYDLLAWTEIERGNKAEARQLLEKALEIDPLLQSARERYGKL